MGSNKINRNRITRFVISVGNFMSKPIFRILVTMDSSYFSAEDCKVKEMVGNRGEEMFRVEVQLKDGQ